MLACTGCATGLTGPTTDVGPEGARIGGHVISDAGGPTEYWVQYGLTTAYGSESAHQTIETTENQPASVAVPIEGLERSTTYHYRLCARDSEQTGGPGCGPDRRFTTQAVGCGETVTADLRLTGNLLCQQTDGLIVGAHGVEINLANHVLEGGITVGGGGPTGILNSGGYDDLTVRNGAVVGFGFGVSSDGNRTRVLDVFASAAGNGVTFTGGAGSEIRNSEVFGRTWGISAESAPGLVIAGSDFEGFFGGGLTATGDFARIVRNRVINRGHEFPVAPGVELVGSQARIADNEVAGPWSRGGIVVSGASNALLDNTVSGAAVPDVPSTSAVFGDGIFIGAFSSGTVLRRNVANGNEGDGIEVRASGTRLGDNTANENGDLGIEAVAGVIDLGGNSASGNGNLLQCLNVVCQ